LIRFVTVSTISFAEILLMSYWFFGTVLKINSTVTIAFNKSYFINIFLNVTAETV